MTHWNHRVVHRVHKHEKFGEEHVYAIHEAYYNDDGLVEGITQDPVEPWGETLEELKSSLQRMSNALTKPILEWDKLPETSPSEDPPEPFGVTLDGE